MIFEDAAIENYAERLDETRAQALHVALGDNGEYDGLEFIWPNLNIKMSDIFEHLHDESLVFISQPD